MVVCCRTMVGRIQFSAVVLLLVQNKFYELLHGPRAMQQCPRHSRLNRTNKEIPPAAKSDRRKKKLLASPECHTRCQQKYGTNTHCQRIFRLLTADSRPQQLSLQVRARKWHRSSTYICSFQIPVILVLFFAIVVNLSFITLLSDVKLNLDNFFKLTFFPKAPYVLKFTYLKSWSLGLKIELSWWRPLKYVNKLLLDTQNIELNLNF